VQDTADKATTFAGLEVPPTSFGNKAPVKTKVEPKPQDEAPAAGVVDPMQWWGALTQQFQTIAAEAMKDAAQKTARNTTQSMAGAGSAAMNTALRSAQAWPTPVAANKPIAKKLAAKKPTTKKPAAKTARQTTR
jgi:hypothetical protein